MSDRSPDRLKVWSDAAALSMQKWQASAAHTIVLDPPPSGIKIQDCATALSSPIDCASSIISTYTNLVTAVDAVAPDGTTHVEVSPWFCSEEGVCPAFIGDTIVLADGGHLTADMSRELVPLMSEAFAPALTH